MAKELIDQNPLPPEASAKKPKTVAPKAKKAAPIVLKAKKIPKARVLLKKPPKKAPKKVVVEEVVEEVVVSTNSRGRQIKRPQRFN